MYSSEKKGQKSVFHRAMGRLSFRTRKNKQTIDKKTKTKQNIQKNISNDQKNPHTTVEVAAKENNEEKVDLLMKDYKESELPIQSSSTYIQSRPITHLEAALKDFQMSTAKSRESLSIPISEKSSLLLRKTEPRQCKEVITTTKCWRQKPPPVNNYLENTWRTLSSSMMDIHKRGEETPWLETDLTKTSSNRNLVKDDKEDRLTKTQSLHVLAADSWSARSTQLQNPSNQLMQMNQYQRRVQASLEKLNVPSWYRSTNTPRLRQSGLSSFYSPWRQQTSDSLPSDNSFRKEINSPGLLSKNSRTKYRTVSSIPRSSSSSSITSTLSSKQVYLGWRSQERIPTIIKSPAERLASSVTNTTATDESIKSVTVAIIEYCNNTLIDEDNDKWLRVSNFATVDTDSGIYRSQDLSQEASKN